MPLLADPETGELFEVLPTDIGGTEPYDFAGWKRMSWQVSREHRAAITAARTAGEDLAKAEVEYHKWLAINVTKAKLEHGATIAETIAKGSPEVGEAKEARDIAAAREKAAMERVRLCRDDRAAALTMGAWSRETGGWEK